MDRRTSAEGRSGAVDGRAGSRSRAPDEPRGSNGGRSGRARSPERKRFGSRGVSDPASVERSRLRKDGCGRASRSAGARLSVSRPPSVEDGRSVTGRRDEAAPRRGSSRAARGSAGRALSEPRTGSRRSSSLSAESSREKRPIRSRLRFGALKSGSASKVGSRGSLGVARSRLENFGRSVFSRSPPDPLQGLSSSRPRRAPDRRDTSSSSDGPKGGLSLSMVCSRYLISVGAATPKMASPPEMTLATDFSSASRARVASMSSSRINRNCGNSLPLFHKA